MALKRITHEPAFVLHRYDWSESSRILEVFTRHHGRTALVAKGAKRPSSNFRPVLLPLQPLQLTYSSDGEIGTLKSAEWVGGHVMPTGEALLSGYYLNELLMRLLARDDPHAALFDSYTTAVALLAQDAAATTEVLEAVLRAFELTLLREVGVLPVFDVQTLTHRPVQADDRYVLLPESGLRQAQPSEARQALAGQHWLVLQQAMDDSAPLHALLHLCMEQRELAQALKQQLRGLLHYHCGVETLRTRQMMLELQKL